MRFADTRWTKPVTDWIPRDVKRTPGRPPTRWPDFFVKALNDRYDALREQQDAHQRRGGSIGPLWHATGTNGDAAGARSSKSMINGTTESIGALWTATGTNGDVAGARSSNSMINGMTGDRGEYVQKCW
ncbi:unnamed protein product [Heligmosomoides polygyrus]|uniref:Transposase n=1 Tax=Heligmosomoides polygyrus TaxID=6339 RepID=A0A183GCE5_HELPZ|nr:unnamed protein product [Heligmosomoides polygyrus]